MAEKGILFGTSSEGDGAGEGIDSSGPGKLKQRLMKLTHRNIDLDNATGGGDSFLGAYVLRRSQGMEPLDAARFALTAAVMNIERSSEGRKSLTIGEIEEHIKDMEIEEFEL